MVLAVTIFNSGSYRFKTGVFAVHLLHEYARIHFFSSTLREYAHMAIVDVLTGSPPAA
jgi:predicted RNA methylase